MSALLEIEGMSAGYLGAPAVRDLSLTVEAGEVVALLGPNGVGKTTTLLTVSGLLPLIEGRIVLLGRETSSRRPHRMARSGLGHVPEDRSLFFGLTVEENLRMGARGRRRSFDWVFEYFPELEPLRQRRAGLLSGGEQQMLALGRALLSHPKLLMVDEMSLGLAPVIVERLMPILRRIAEEQGAGMLLVEQHIQMVLGIADRGYVLAHGQLMVQGSADTLLARRDVIEATYFGEDEFKGDDER